MSSLSSAVNSLAAVTLEDLEALRVNARAVTSERERLTAVLNALAEDETRLALLMEEKRAALYAVLGEPVDH